MHTFKSAVVLGLASLAAGRLGARDGGKGRSDGSSKSGGPGPSSGSSGSGGSSIQLDAQQIAALRVLGKEPVDFRLPGSLPNPALPAGTDLLPGIEHIVMIMQENHSWDNIWGTLDRPDTDGLQLDVKTKKPIVTQKYANGSIQHAYQMPETCQPTANGPTQNWLSSHEQYNNGSMDGFVIGGGIKPIAMGYFVEEQLPFTHSIGKTFPIGDRFFCSVLGQTWPNRMYLIGATSMGVVNTGQVDDIGLIPPGGTIFNTLDKFNISWENYVANS
jgi:phospholipase C